MTALGTWVAISKGMSSSALSLLWWVGIGLLFFWMMSRGGCGMGGHSHRRERDHEHGKGHAPRSASGKPIDPVCGMEVDPTKAAGTRVVMGETYFLCSQNCLDTFDKTPATYAHARETEPTQQHRHAGC